MASDNEDDDLEALRKAALATIKQKAIEKVIGGGISYRPQNSPPWSDIPASIDFPGFGDPIPEASQIPPAYESTVQQHILLQHGMRPVINNRWHTPSHNGMIHPPQRFRHGFGGDRKVPGPRFPQRTFGDRGANMYDRGNKRWRRGYLPSQTDRDAPLPRIPPGSFPPGHPHPGDSAASLHVGANLIVIQPQTPSQDGTVPLSSTQAAVALSNRSTATATTTCNSYNSRTGSSQSSGNRDIGSSSSRSKLFLPQDKYHSNVKESTSTASPPTDQSATMKTKDKFSRFDKSDSEEDDLSEVDDIANEIDKVLQDDFLHEEITKQEEEPQEKEKVEDATREGKSPDLVQLEAISDDDLVSSVSDKSDTESLEDLDALASGEPILGDFEDLDCLVDKEPDSVASVSEPVIGNDKDSVHSHDDVEKDDITHLISCGGDVDNEMRSLGLDVRDHNLSIDKSTDRPLSNDRSPTRKRVSPIKHNSSPRKSSISPRRYDSHRRDYPSPRRSRSPLQSRTTMNRRSVSPRRAPYRRSRSPRRYSPLRRSLSPRPRRSPFSNRKVTPPLRNHPDDKGSYNTSRRRSLSPPHRARSPLPRDRMRDDRWDVGRTRDYRSSRYNDDRRNAYRSHRDRPRLQESDRSERQIGSGSQQEKSNPRVGSGSQQEKSNPRVGSGSQQERSNPRVGSGSQQEKSNPRVGSGSHQEKSDPRVGSGSQQEKSNPRVGSDSQQERSNPRDTVVKQENDSFKKDSPVKFQEIEDVTVDLEKLTPEERVKIEARRKKFGNKEEVKVTDGSKKISLKSVKHREKKSKKKEEKEVVTKEDEALPDISVNKKQTTGISLKKLRKKQSKKNELQEEQESPKTVGLVDLDDDSEDSDGDRSWKRESAGLSKRENVALSKRENVALSKRENVALSGSGMKFRSSSSYTSRRHEMGKRDFTSRKHSNQLLLEKPSRRKELKPVRMQKNTWSSDDDDEGGIEAKRLTSSIVPAKPFVADIPPEKLRIQVQVASKSKEGKKKSKALPDFANVYSVHAKRKRSAISKSPSDDEEVPLPTKKVKKKKEKKKKHAKESPSSDTGLFEEMQLLDATRSPTKPSVLERLGKMVNLKSMEKEKKKKSKKSHSTSTDEGSRDLDDHMLKMKAKNKEILRRQREIELDKKKYG